MVDKLGIFFCEIFVKIGIRVKEAFEKLVLEILIYKFIYKVRLLIIFRFFMFIFI